MTRHKLTGREFTIRFSNDVTFSENEGVPYYYFCLTTLDGEEEIEGWSPFGYADAFDNVLGNAL